MISQGGGRVVFISVTRYTGDDVHNLKCEGECVINTRYIEAIEELDNGYYFIDFGVEHFQLYVTEDDYIRIHDSLNIVLEINEDEEEPMNV